MKKSYSRNFYYFIIALIILIISIIFLRIDSKKQININYYNSWKNNYVKDINSKEAYIDSTPNCKIHTSISEGQGYGMLICVLASNHINTQTDFDKLNCYYLKHCLKNSALMSWKQTIYKNKIKEYPNNATDGDIYIAYSLYKAAKKWPNQANKYRKEANHIVRDILKYDYNKSQQILTVGNWANAHTKFYNMIRTSDVMPLQFEKFYEETKNKKWLLIKKRMLFYLSQLSAQHKTGLIPDFAWVNNNNVKPVKSKTIASKYDGDYYYNACRIPYNLAQSKNYFAKKIIKKMMKFFMKQNTIKAGYYLNGKPISDSQSPVFGIPLLFVSLNYPDHYDKIFEQEKFILMRPLSKKNYYESVLVTLVAIQINDYQI